MLHRLGRLTLTSVTLRVKTFHQPAKVFHRTFKSIPKLNMSFVGSILVKSALLDLGIQWGLFPFAAGFKTEKFYDLAGSGTFLILAYKSLQWGQKYFLRQKIQTGMVMTWAARLGIFLVSRILKDGPDRRFDKIRDSVPTFFVAWTLQGLYLFSRVIKDGKDRRFDKVRGNPQVFFQFWTIQALWVFITILPVLIVNSKQEDRPLTTQDYVGYGMWAVGFLFEAISDYQKSVFRSNPDNAGKFISTGLWSISRHPNYFGEILLWLGLFVSSSSVLKGWENISIISPIFVALLLTKVSGIPMLERSGLKRWGADPLYQEYIKKTAVLVPFVW